MSHTTVLSLKPNHVEELEELRNSHGTAPVIWDAMCQKYLNAKPYRYSEHIDDLWPLYKDKRIPEYQRAVLIMTFDHARIEKKNFARAASDIRRWLNEFPVEQTRCSHWPRIAEILGSDPDCENIGFHQTSVTENPFKPWDEEKRRSVPIDWDKTYEVYAELAEVGKE